MLFKVDHFQTSTNSAALKKREKCVAIPGRVSDSPRQDRNVFPSFYEQSKLVHICLIDPQAKILRYNRSPYYCESPNTNRVETLCSTFFSSLTSKLHPPFQL